MEPTLEKRALCRGLGGLLGLQLTEAEERKEERDADDGEQLAGCDREHNHAEVGDALDDRDFAFDIALKRNRQGVADGKAGKPGQQRLQIDLALG